MTEQKASIQDIFLYARDHNQIDESNLTRKQLKTVNDICSCRTEQAGFNADECPNCGYKRIHYNSCRNPACPMCQAFSREEWVQKEEYYRLNITYYHCVFTVPAELNPYIMLDKSFGYHVLFSSAARVLNTLAADEKYLGAQIGFTAVLHTWGSNLSFHPHLHCVISGGGISENGMWKSKDRFLFPIRVLSRLFRGSFLCAFRKKFDRSLLKDPGEFDSVIEKCFQKEWVVYMKEPFTDPDSVIRYLGRYTHRIAISNARIIRFSDGIVTFSYKDYHDQNRIKEMTLSAKEFVRRFLIHVLPKHFTKIRHYGFLASRDKKKRFRILRAVTRTEEKGEYQRDVIGIICRIIGHEPVCPHCHKPWIMKFRE